MSYVLHIWENPPGRPWPASVEEADRVLHALQATASDQNPKFVALVHKLTSRYPASPTREDMLQGPAWTDGPLDGETDTAVFTVGIGLRRWNEIQPFVVEQARSLGLNVTDELSGDVFLASGATLRYGPARSAGAQVSDAQEVPRARDLEPVVVDRLMSLMKQHGYKFSKSHREFRSTFPGGWHRISVTVQDVESGCEIRVGACNRLHAVSELLHSIVAPNHPVADLKEIPTTIIGQRAWLDELGGFAAGLNNEYRLERHADLDRLLEHLGGKLVARLFPILEKYKTVDGLDALLNPDPVSGSVLFQGYNWGAVHIIAAFLAGNPKLEALCAEFESQARDARYNQRVLQCIQYVRGRPRLPAAGS